jgi:hypothetical protein
MRKQRSLPATPTRTHREIRPISLALAHFPTDDPDLVGHAGSCRTCPNRINILKGPDLCGHLPCFQAKRRAWNGHLLANARALGYVIIQGPRAKKIVPSPDSALRGFARPTDPCAWDPARRSYAQLLAHHVPPALLRLPHSGDFIFVIDLTTAAAFLREHPSIPFRKRRPSTPTSSRARDTSRTNRTSKTSGRGRVGSTSL